MSEIAIVVIAVVLGIVVGGAVVYILQRERSTRLKKRFGPEYSRTVEETGDRHKAEAALQQRARRVEKLHLRALEPSEREGFLESWRGIQGRFIDDPHGTL